MSTYVERKLTWGSACSKGSGRVLRTIVQNVGEIVVTEGSVLLSLQTIYYVKPSTTYTKNRKRTLRMSNE